MDFGEFSSGKKAARFRLLVEKGLMNDPHNPITVLELNEMARLYVGAKGRLPPDQALKNGRLVWKSNGKQVVP